MPDCDIFALDRAGFNGFLFAGIGSEANGSSLTVLSALARLGEDPWALAASWAAMSHAAAAEALAACIRQMPLMPTDLRAAPHTAARLVLLLSTAATAAPLQRVESAASPRAGLLLTLVSALAFAGVLVGGAFMVGQHRTATQAAPSAPARSLGPRSLGH